MSENKTQVIKDNMNQYISKLCNELRQGHSDLFKSYLKVISKFHKYSFGNQMLIASQMPTATRVAGFKAWQKLGRQVKKGEKAIYVLAPSKGKRKVSKSGEEKEVDCLWFRAVPVFDSSSTEGEELPEWCHDLGEDTLNVYNRLKAAMIQRGISVTECKISGGALGVSYGGRIEIEESMDPMNKALVLIHEVAHEILHRGSENSALSRGFKECQAEATAYVVAQHFGMDSPFTKDYLLNWGNKEEELKENLTAVIKASQEIIEILSGEEGIVPEVSVSEDLEQCAA